MIIIRFQHKSLVRKSGDIHIIINKMKYTFLSDTIISNLRLRDYMYAIDVLKIWGERAAK